MFQASHLATINPDEVDFTDPPKDHTDPKAELLGVMVLFYVLTLLSLAGSARRCPVFYLHQLMFPKLHGLRPSPRWLSALMVTD